MKKYILLIAAYFALTGLSSCSKENNPAPENNYLEFTLIGNSSSSYSTDAENKASKTFLSLVNKTTLDYAGALASQDKTDLVLRTSRYNGAIPESTRGLFLSSMQVGDYGGDSNFEDFSIRLSCSLAYVSDNEFTFESVTDVASLKAGFAKISAGEFNETANLVSGVGSNETKINTVAFKTALGKIGVMRISGYSPQKPFTYTINVKMER